MTFASDQAAMQARAETVLAQAQTYLNALVDQANQVLITGTTVLPEQYNYATVPTVQFPVLSASRPVISAPTTPVPSAPEFSFSQLPSLIALPVDDLLAPTGVFTFAEAAYESTLLDPLKSKLLDNLLNGGYGIENADELALMNRARDREVEIALTRVTDAGRAMAARGFPLPPGELSIHEARAYQGMQDKVSDVSRDIMVKRGDLYVENRRFTITETRAIETVLMNYWNSVQERAVNVAKLSVEMSILVYNALLARFRARLEAARISADVSLIRSQAEVAQVTARFEVFRTQVAAYEANLRAILDPARLAVDLYRSDVDAARMVNDGTIARAALQQKVLEATVQQNIQISSMTIENARARLLGLIEQIRFRTHAVQYGSEKFFAQLTAIESTVNALTVESTTT